MYVAGAHSMRVRIRVLAAFDRKNQRLVSNAHSVSDMACHDTQLHLTSYLHPLHLLDNACLPYVHGVLHAHAPAMLHWGRNQHH
jgi:hypothetical protein